jgi:copper chaperone CopZ
MKSFLIATLSLLAIASLAAAPAIAFAQEAEDPSPVIVTVSDLPICCGASVQAIQQAASIAGVQAQVDQDQQAVVLTAEGYDDVERALESLARAGFYGQIEDDTQAGKVQFPPIRTPEGNVPQLVIRHVYNGCRCCSDAIIAALESVDGVSSYTVQPKVESFVVKGNFNAGEVVAALQDAGFYPTIE